MQNDSLSLNTLFEVSVFNVTYFHRQQNLRMEKMGTGFSFFGLFNLNKDILSKEAKYIVDI